MLGRFYINLYEAIEVKDDAKASKTSTPISKKKASADKYKQFQAHSNIQERLYPLQKKGEKNLTFFEQQQKTTHCGGKRHLLQFLAPKIINNH